MFKGIPQHKYERLVWARGEDCEDEAEASNNNEGNPDGTHGDRIAVDTKTKGQSVARLGAARHTKRSSFESTVIPDVRRKLTYPPGG